MTHQGETHQGEGLAERQRQHWQATYTTHPGMYGPQPSQAAVYAAGVFAEQGAVRVAELGAGHGRDTLYLARQGFSVEAVDFSATGVEQLDAAAEQEGLPDRVRALVHDVRTPLPWPDASLDGVFAHMLLCMALSTQEIITLVAEVARVLRPGGTFVYTVRHTGDAHYGSGTAHGDDIFEHGGFAVHFFDRALVDRLAAGWQLRQVHDFTEGELPRRLWRITQVRPGR
ncbi:MAG: class I SAM-dependent methyltransferase [Streptomyces sp.]|nr:class I SAM-dependent methyltransferase [Streptomyces sp.]